MKCWAISDTHGMHKQAIVPDNIDLFIFAGDSTNYFNLYQNQPEFDDFYNWLINLPIPCKVIIAGNHDTWATKAYNRDKLKDNNIIYLEHEYHYIGKPPENPIKIFGSPYTPTFGNWNFMKDRSKLDNYWKDLDSDIDILITHGPPLGILDLTENRDYQFEQTGDLSLYKRVMEKKNQNIIYLDIFIILNLVEIKDYFNMQIIQLNL